MDDPAGLLDSDSQVAIASRLLRRAARRPGRSDTRQGSPVASIRAWRYFVERSNTKPLRVIQWATGGVGKAAVEAVLNHPELELVGCWVHSADKNGRDVGE